MTVDPGSHPDQAGLRARLESLRTPLLNLHKSLVDSERADYERTMGKIQSPNHFLQLLTDDPWFAWLSPLSQLIVSIDETLDAKEPLTSAMVEALVKQAARLLVASEDLHEGADFGRHYFEALQRDPSVVMAHGEVTKVEGWRKAGSRGSGTQGVSQ